jgi:hypothetical protein
MTFLLPTGRTLRNHKKTIRNLQYLKSIERNKAMSGRIIDPMGIPMSGNNQPQSGANPVFVILLPMFNQTLQTMLSAEPLNRPNNVRDPNAIVETAWDIATKAFAKFGFKMEPVAETKKPI